MESKNLNERVTALDPLRFFAATWVFLFHWGGFVDRGNICGLWGAIFNGPSAVIVFFVISGFCIHFPFRGQTNDLHVFPFLLRRYIRLGLPLLIARIWSPSFQISAGALIDAVGWSLIIELIFYSIYPFLRIPRSSRSWIEYLSCFFVLAWAVVVWRNYPQDYGSWGHFFNWMLAFPCWMLGCCLAEHYNQLPKRFVPSATLWKWRVGILPASGLCSWLYCHSPVGYPWTLNILSIGLFFWLRLELSDQKKETPLTQALAWGGKWSYSIYLVHGLGLNFTANWAILGAPQLVNYLAQGFGVFAFCYGFYLVVEKPSHWLARFLAVRLDSCYAARNQVEDGDCGK